MLYYIILFYIILYCIILVYTILDKDKARVKKGIENIGRAPRYATRPVHLLGVFLLRVFESNFPGDSL